MSLKGMLKGISAKTTLEMTIFALKGIHDDIDKNPERAKDGLKSLIQSAEKKLEKM